VSAAAQLRISRLAAEPSVHRAFRWLHLHQPQIRAWQLEMLHIPAPPFGETRRAEWFLDRFQALGLSNVRMDEVGNALGELGGADGVGDGPVVLLSAHLDTVFPPDTEVAPTEVDGRILGPGACDNAAGLSGLLGLAAALREARLTPAVTVVFAANVGEEGEGDLRGMRHLFSASPYAGRIAAAIALEGGGSSAVITRALASRRFRVTVTGPGGHSWADAGVPNPILQLAKGLVALGQIEFNKMDAGSEAITAPTDSTGVTAGAALALGPGGRRTTLNIGLISGGTSVNSIPAVASAHLDVRSTDTEHLNEIGSKIREILKQSIPEDVLAIETIGDRPGGCLPVDSSLLMTLRAVDRHLNLRTEPGLGSTDANIPLSLGIPAIAIGAGGNGGGIHTLQEWYDPTGRQASLRRILLTLLDTAAQSADGSEVA
jgi:tripeptide aminopeptidase